jgi:predicted acylesterase/phospholipase RssA
MGTSAGAIVGAMIAANVDIEKFRSELQESNRRPLLEELRSGSGANTRLSLMGRTYWRSDALKKLIKDTFAAQGVATVADVLTKHGSLLPTRGGCFSGNLWSPQLWSAAGELNHY